MMIFWKNLKNAESKNNMKIVKPGKIPKFKGKCNLCSCEIEAEYKEFMSSGYGGKTMITSCPTDGCGHTISLFPERPRSNGISYKCESDFVDEEECVDES